MTARPCAFRMIFIDLSGETPGANPMPRLTETQAIGGLAMTADSRVVAFSAILRQSELSHREVLA